MCAEKPGGPRMDLRRYDKEVGGREGRKRGTSFCRVSTGRTQRLLGSPYSRWPHRREREAGGDGARQVSRKGSQEGPWEK